MAGSRRSRRSTLLRMTPPRRAVHDAVATCGDHPTAAQIYACVRLTQPGIAYATVYNALRALVEHGAVLQLTFGDAASRYDPRPERHDHALCVGCQSLVDVAPSRPCRRAWLRRRGSACAPTARRVRTQRKRIKLILKNVSPRTGKSLDRPGNP